VPETRPLPCHSSSGLVLYSRVPQRLHALHLGSNRSGAEGDLKELNAWTPQSSPATAPAPAASTLTAPPTTGS
jgi:hypothetical protein